MSYFRSLLVPLIFSTAVSCVQKAKQSEAKAAKLPTAGFKFPPAREGTLTRLQGFGSIEYFKGMRSFTEAEKPESHLAAFQVMGVLPHDLKSVGGDFGFGTDLRFPKIITVKVYPFEHQRELFEWECVYKTGRFDCKDMTGDFLNGSTLFDVDSDNAKEKGPTFNMSAHAQNSDSNQRLYVNVVHMQTYGPGERERAGYKGDDDILLKLNEFVEKEAKTSTIRVYTKLLAYDQSEKCVKEKTQSFPEVDVVLPNKQVGFIDVKLKFLKPEVAQKFKESVKSCGIFTQILREKK